MQTTLDSFIAACRSSASATYLGNGRLLATALGGRKVVLDAGDMGLTPNLACDGFWEPGISIAMARLLTPGMVAVDIGANIGYFTVLMADAVGPTGSVVAVEANPALASLLAETIVMNGLGDRVTLHGLAASDADASLDFYVIPERNLNSGILLDEWRDRVLPAQVQTVRAVPADALLADLKRVDLIKIDVEGAEHMVYAGLAGTIARNPEITLIVEYNFMRHSRARELIPMIEAQGFALREVREDGSVVEVQRASLFDAARYDDRMLLLSRRATLS